MDRNAPTTLSYVVAAALVAGVTGFFIGQAVSVGVFGSSSAAASSGTASRDARERIELEDDEEDEDDEDERQDGVKAFDDSHGECKMTLCVRTDLGMGKGKIAAQCAHATLANYKTLRASAAGRTLLRRWERLGQAKVALQVASADQLALLQAQALSLGVAARVIHDAGRTQIAAGSATVLAVGPAPRAVVDQITGALKLL